MLIDGHLLDKKNVEIYFVCYTCIQMWCRKLDEQIFLDFLGFYIEIIKLVEIGYQIIRK